MNVESGSFELVASDQTRLHVGYEVSATPTAAVLLQHGIASHQAWYRPLARTLADAGMAVYIPDRRGAGRSGGPPCHMDDHRHLSADLQLLREEIAKRHGSLPLHALGISLGAVVLLALELEHPGTFRSAVLVAPGFASARPIPLFRRLRVLRRSLFEPEWLYPLPFGPAELTENEEWALAIRSDPRRGAHASARFLVQLFRLQSLVWKRRGELQLPLCLLLAGADRVVDNRRALRLVEGTRARTIATEVFHGAPHMLPPARPAAEFRDLLLAWVRQGHEEPGRRVREHDPWSGPLDALPTPPLLSESAE